ncbi:MAG TPA: sortase [Candidatus Limnocylindria bacterium]|nr:sortase [Candidatus Limnocylindria bacterium]
MLSAVPAPQTPSGTVSTAPPAELPTGPIASGYRVSVPRLQIDLPIAEGDVERDITDQRTPEGFAFHLPGTAVPGQNGNTYLYAHARQGMFLSLWNARPGDEVLIAAPDGHVLVYVMREVFPRVPPTDVSSTQPTTVERLTLQTSTGPSPRDPRFVVFAFPRGR